MSEADSPQDQPSGWRSQRWVACGLPAAAGPPPVSDVAAEVARLGCVQAQEFDMTLWSLSQRTGASRAQVLSVLADGEVVRTHAMRPTWHFVHRDDLVRVQSATAGRVHRIARPYLRSQGVDEATLEAWRAWLTDLLRAGPLTRAEIRAQVAASTFAFDALTLGFALMWAELELVIASGPPRGQVHTYQLLGEAPRLDPEESGRWLVERFLSSHGPSKAADVAAWSGLTLTAIRRAVAELGTAVHSMELLGDRRYWIGPLAEDGWAADPNVELLNGFDEYISGLDPASKAMLDPDGLHRERAGTPTAVLMIDGCLAGHWRRTTARGQLRVHVALLRPLAPAEMVALGSAVERYGRFAEAPITLEITGP